MFHDMFVYVHDVSGLKRPTRYDFHGMFGNVLRMKLTVIVSSLRSEVRQGRLHLDRGKGNAHCRAIGRVARSRRQLDSSI